VALSGPEAGVMRCVIVAPDIVAYLLPHGSTRAGAPGWTEVRRRVPVSILNRSPDGVVIVCRRRPRSSDRRSGHGAYSLTQQTMQLGFLPSKRVQYTASHEKGQIYIPVVNRLVAAGTLGAVITFGALGGAYGIAVSMLNTCREPAGGR
jgi:hypothetical protein